MSLELRIKNLKARHIEAAQKAAEASAELERLTRLQVTYPDLAAHSGRWNKEVLCSKSVNGLVDKYDMRHNCGCCDDSPLEIWPYLDTADGRVYSDPACFRVGERGYYGGDSPYDGWDHRMHEAGISTTIIECVRLYFADNPALPDPDCEAEPDLENPL